MYEQATKLKTLSSRGLTPLFMFIKMVFLREQRAYMSHHYMPICKKGPEILEALTPHHLVVPGDRSKRGRLIIATLEDRKCN